MKKYIKPISFILLLVSVFLLYGSVKESAYGNKNYEALAPRNLYWGSQGEDVREAQRRLIDWKYMTGSADGIFGPETYRGVRRFQQKHSLAVDGVIGPKTAHALGISLEGGGAAPTASTGISRSGDEYLLARCIHGEARGEPYIGKVAVGAVVLNRTRSPEFPNTIAGVIYQPLAFTAVADGQINLTPDKDSIKAARDALNGWDPTYGTLYYWNPVTATSKWIWSRQVTLKIGKHWFGI